MHSGRHCGLVETRSLPLCLHPQRRPHVHTTQTQVVLAVQREVTEQVSGPDSDRGGGSERQDRALTTSPRCHPQPSGPGLTDSGGTDRQGRVTPRGSHHQLCCLSLGGRIVNKPGLCPLLSVLGLAVLVSLTTLHRASPGSAWHTAAALPCSPHRPGHPASHPPRVPVVTKEPTPPRPASL